MNSTPKSFYSSALERNSFFHSGRMDFLPTDLADHGERVGDPSPKPANITDDGL